MTDKLPKALRLADALDIEWSGVLHPTRQSAAAELRLLHASVEALEQKNLHRHERMAALEKALEQALEALEQMREAFLDVDGSHGSLERRAEEAADAALATVRQTLGGKHD